MKNTFYSLVALVAVFVFGATMNVTAQNSTNYSQYENCYATPEGFVGETEPTLCDIYGVEIYELCIYVGVGSPSNITHTSQIGQSFSNGQIFVLGDLIVDNDFNAHNCIIKINANVTITIESHYSLTLDNSKLFACEDLWNGIVLNTYSNIITKNSTQIEDAKVAIKAQDISYSFMEISNTIFNRDVVGIQMSVEPYSAHPPMIDKFLDNKFSCTSPINGTASDISTVGLLLNNIPFFAWSGSQPSNNQFENIQWGIQAFGDNSTLNLSSFSFENIRHAGIFIEKGSLKISQNSTFKNCREDGIFIMMPHSVSILDCTFIFDEELPDVFNLPPIGIHIDHYSPIGAIYIGDKVVVKDCTFNMDFTSSTKRAWGMWLASAYNASGSNYTIGTGSSLNPNAGGGNNFNIKGFGCLGMYLSGDFPINASVSIKNNSFYLSIPGFGASSTALDISGGNKYNFTVEDNTFDAPPVDATINGLPIGISLEGYEGTNNNVTSNHFPENSITVIFNLFTYLSAIQVNGFKNTTYCNNFISGVNRAFVVSGLNDNSALVDNTVHGSRLIEIFPNSWVDEQFQNANKWYPLYYLINNSGPIAIYVPTQAVCSGDPQYSFFTTHTTQSTGYYSPGLKPYHPKAITPDLNNEFWDYENGTPNACLSGFNQPVSKLDRDVADLALNTNDPSTTWQAQRSLFSRLVNGLEDVNGYASFSTFSNQMTQSNIKKLVQVEKQMNDAINGDNQQLQLALNISQQIDLVLNSLKTNSADLSVGGNSSVISGLHQSREELIGQLNSLQLQLAGINSSFKNTLAPKLQNIKIINDNITPGNVMEENEKSINDYLLTMALMDGAITQEQVDQIESIADQEPSEGGGAVYRARGLNPCMKNYSSLTYSPLPSTSSPIEEREGEMSNLTEINNKILVTPNPATSEFSITLLEGIGSKIQIFDSRGCIVNEVKVISTTTTFTTSEMQSGLYYFVVHSPNGYKETGKILITKN